MLRFIGSLPRRGEIDCRGELWFVLSARMAMRLNSLILPFTTCPGVPSDSYSLEIRAMAREATPLDDQDPAVYVARRGGRPAVVGSNCSDAHPPRTSSGCLLAEMKQRP